MKIKKNKHGRPLKKQVGLTLRVDHIDKLKEIALAQDVSCNSLIQQAVKMYIDNQQ